MEERKLSTFFVKHLWSCLIGVICLITCGVLAERTFFPHKSEQSQDFFIVRKLFDNLASGEMIAQESIDQAEQILNRHPELHAEYDHLLTLCFQRQENAQKVAAIATPALKRSENLLPSVYTDFGKISLLITEKNYPQAFVLASNLESTLTASTSPESFETLRALNLLRLTFLAKKLGDIETEQQSYASLKKLSVFAELKPLFQEGSFTLDDYILPL